MAWCGDGAELLHEAHHVRLPPVLGEPGELVEISDRQNCDEVVVAMPDAPQGLLKQLAEDCYRAHVRFRDAQIVWKR